MASVTDPYLREQLEKRREELTTAISVAPADPAPLRDLLHEVDDAIHRMDEGTYGVCEGCQGTVENERLIADPLVQL